MEVFVVEQGAAYPELDGRDLEGETELFWVEEGGEVLATLRRLLDEGANGVAPIARIGRVATASSARGRGLAADLTSAAVMRATERWPGRRIDLDAQAHLAPWCARFGFTASGPTYLEDDIPHVLMTRPGD